MEKEVQSVLEILENFNNEKKMAIITQCVSKIGTSEWQDKIRDLIQRIENLSN